MRKWTAVLGLLVTSSTVFAQMAKTSQSIDLSAAAAQEVGTLLRNASRAGDTAVQFIGGPQVTQYMTGNVDCYFQDNDDSVSCSAPSELSGDEAKEIGKLLRNANIGGDKAVQFIGSQAVTQYVTGNVDCAFQNSDDSVSCSVDPK